MKSLFVVLALTVSVSALAEQPKYAAGLNPGEKLGILKSTKSEQPAPRVSEEKLSVLRRIQMRYMELIKKAGKEEAKLTPEERAEFERQATY